MNRAIMSKLTKLKIGEFSKMMQVTVKTRLHPMLEDVRKVLVDVDSGLRDDVI